MVRRCSGHGGAGGPVLGNHWLVAGPVSLGIPALGCVRATFRASRQIDSRPLLRLRSVREAERMLSRPSHELWRLRLR